MRIAYRILFRLVLPFALLRLLWRARRQPDYRRHFAERFGFSPPVGGNPIWIHAVSVGETRAAQPLVEALRARHPGLPILLTCTTPTGRAAAAQLYPDVSQAYLPYDLTGAVKRFLRRQQPRAGILMETELWPELMLACQRLGVPLFVVNARLSQRSARRYAWAGPFIRQVLQSTRVVAAQSEADAGRFRALGAPNVHVCGNLKFDRAANAGDLDLAERFKQRFAGRVAVLVASSREGEEAPLLAQWKRVAPAGALLVLVPRHPQRFDEVALLVAQHGLTCQRRSDDSPVRAATTVWLGDSMGEMYAYHAACEVSIIGGSFLALGGQNLLEACTVARPVIVGPHMFNFAEATQLAFEAGAALQVSSAQEAIDAALALSVDLPRARTMGQKGLDLMRAHQGATERVVELLGF